MLNDSLIARVKRSKREKRKIRTYLSNLVVAMLLAGTRPFVWYITNSNFPRIGNRHNFQLMT
jgi:hypothetical protein